MAQALSAAVGKALSIAALGLVVSYALFNAQQQELQNYTGTVTMRQVEGGCLVLQTADRVYELASKTKLEPGERVTIEGVIRDDWASFCMAGPIIEVVSVHQAKGD